MTDWKSEAARIRKSAGSTLCRERGTSPATAGGENGTASTRAHAQAEAVRLGAPTIVRLERALGHGNSEVLGVVKSADQGYGVGGRPSNLAVRVGLRVRKG